MTQHTLQEQTDEDQRTLRRLSLVVGAFMLATVVLAVGVTLVVG